MTAPMPMSAAKRAELTDWLAWMFEALATDSIWDDLTPRSQNNGFHWDVASPEVKIFHRSGPQVRETRY
jgi:hypothetical protein